MIATDAVFVGKKFNIGLRRQKIWGPDMAISFFLGEIGAGVFLLSLYFGFMPGIISGLIVTTIGKTVGHLLHLGRPERAWRAITMLGSSWLSRGLLAIILYASCGGLYVLNHLYQILPESISSFCALVAAAAAVMIMLYQGLIMSHSASITLWASGLMPVIGLTYALFCGSALLILAEHSNLIVVDPNTLSTLQTLRVVLLTVAAAAVWGLLHAAHWGSSGGRESVKRLLKQDLAPWFFTFVVVLGFGVPAITLYLGVMTDTLLYLSVIAQISGFLCFRLLLRKAGNYDALMQFASPHRGF